jgi:asparagine synthase (glutamine-hydrolysing)
MSGICGLFNLDDAPVDAPELSAMTALLETRGPDTTNTWLDGSIGFGHTLLATTPELQYEKQPFAHAETGCTITADVRLDNRDELLDSLGLSERHDRIGDAELILKAYLRWGDDCVGRLMGDFAFAIWDPRHQRLFCARDHFGMRPLYYYSLPGKHFIFASDSRAIVVLPRVPYRINEGRIADFLVPELEWYDYRSTFYEDVFRLPPGHRIAVTCTGIEESEYWHPQPGPELGQMTDDDYRQGFIEVFSTAVESRLRAPPKAVGSTLSGGMDSGSVVAFAKQILEARGEAPLQTYSAAQRRDSNNPNNLDCPESQAIYAASSMTAISPTLVYPDSLDQIFGPLTSDFDEPFDGVFVLLKTIFLAAKEQGNRVMLDGAGGDVVLNEGSYISRLIRQGQFKLAMSEIIAEHRYWSEGSPGRRLAHYAGTVVVPEAIKNHVRRSRQRRQVAAYINASLISPGFAQSIEVEKRFDHMRKIFPCGWQADYAQEFCAKIRPNMTAGCERYDRIAASTGSEARDPFMDKRVIDFCSRLPGRFRLRDGWPKTILRDVTADILPREVLWTKRKPHLGWMFYEEVTRQAVIRGELTCSVLEDSLDGYVDSATLSQAWQNYIAGDDSGHIPHLYFLSIWLRRTAKRPVVPNPLFM